jgi:hypothetical protein
MQRCETNLRRLKTKNVTAAAEARQTATKTAKRASFNHSRGQKEQKEQTKINSDHEIEKHECVARSHHR